MSGEKNSLLYQLQQEVFFYHRIFLVFPLTFKWARYFILPDNISAVSTLLSDTFRPIFRSRILSASFRIIFRITFQRHEPDFFRSRSLIYEKNLIIIARNKYEIKITFSSKMKQLIGFRCKIQI